MCHLLLICKQCVIVLAKDKTHDEIWDIILKKLLPLTEVNRQGATKEKIAGF